MAAKQIAPRKTSATDLHYWKVLCNNSSTETQTKHNRIFIENPLCSWTKLCYVLL